MSGPQTISAPIFICGASRSGTALVRSILNRHPEVFISGETHYFDDLRVRMADKVDAKLSDDERRVCEDYFLALGHRPYGHFGDPEGSIFSRADLRALADEIGGGADAYFEAFCRLGARDEGATIWGEKTPRHIFRIDEILERYPGARIICMVRDPRAVIASYRDWRHQGGFDFEKDPEHRALLEQEEARARKSYHIIIASLLWKAAVGAALAARKKHGEDRVRIQKYELLAIEPETAARELCDWLGLHFDPALLEVPVHNSSFAQFDERGGVRTEGVARWKTKLTPRETGIIQSCCGRVMKEAGYEFEPVPTPRIALAWSWMTVPFAAARAVLANRKRIGNLPAYLWRRLRFST